MTPPKSIIQTIDILLKEIRKNAISKEHRKAELNLDCPECRFRILEGLLSWWKDSEEEWEKSKGTKR